MSCNINADVWFDYVENELDSSFKKDLTVHLKECGPCQKNYAEFKLTRRILATEEIEMPTDAVFRNMTDKIMASLDKAPQKVEKEMAEVIHPFWFRRLAVPVAAAAALVFIIAGGLFTTSSFHSNVAGNSLAKQEMMTEQFIEQAESTNPQVVGNSMVTSQDEDDMVLDAAAAKLSRMSDTEARTMLDNMK